jgi:hypothetical protein
MRGGKSPRGCGITLENVVYMQRMWRPCYACARCFGGPVSAFRRLRDGAESLGHAQKRATKSRQRATSTMAQASLE